MWMLLAPTTTSSLWLVLSLLFVFQQSHSFVIRPSQLSSHNAFLPCPTTTLGSTPKDDESSNTNEPIDLSLDSRLYKVRLSRATGIDWGTDLSFSFVYVRDMDPSGEAKLSGKVKKGDQLCEQTPIDRETGESGSPINLLGAPFDFVMDSFVTLKNTVRDVDFVFFRGTKDELKAVCTGESSTGEPEMITVTVIENKGSKDEAVKTFQANAGVNVRELLTANGINVYQSVTRWTNCKGKQLCGTCIVNITEGSIGTNRKSMDEGSTLRENPDSYRLSCVTFAYGDITVETFPPINAAQWTR
jgi:ferredoxin